MLIIYTYRMKPKRIEWYGRSSASVIEDFSDVQRECEFRMKLGGSHVYFNVLEAVYDRGWHVLVQFEESKKVAEFRYRSSPLGREENRRQAAVQFGFEEAEAREAEASAERLPSEEEGQKCRCCLE
jgi:hypothetical protein